MPILPFTHVISTLTPPMFRIIDVEVGILKNKMHRSKRKDSMRMYPMYSNNNSNHLNIQGFPGILEAYVNVSVMLVRSLFRIMQ